MNFIECNPSGRLANVLVRFRKSAAATAINDPTHTLKVLLNLPKLYLLCDLYVVGHTAWAVYIRDVPKSKHPELVNAKQVVVVIWTIGVTQQVAVSGSSKTCLFICHKPMSTMFPFA